MKQKNLVLLAAALMLAMPMAAQAIAPVNTEGAGIYNQLNRNKLFDFKRNKQIDAQIDKEDSAIDEQYYMREPRDFYKDGVIYNPQFKVNSIVFEGNKSVSDATLNALSEDVIGRDVYFADLVKLATKITKYYQAKGYLTSYVFIPSQSVKDGILTLSIVESTVDSVEIEGNKWARDAYLKKIVFGKKGIREGDIFNAKQLQGALREINEEDYIDVQSVISKRGDDTVLHLDVKDRFPIRFDVGWDDYGRKYTGEQRASLILGMENLTGFGDKIYGGTILSSHATGVLAGYSVPISSYGTRLSFDFSHSNVGLAGPYRDLNVKGKARSMAIRVTHPFIHNQKTKLTGYTGIDFVSATTESRKLNYKISDYDLFVLRSGIQGIFDDKKGRWITNLGADVGLPGATSNIKNGPQSVFVKVIAGATRVQRLFGRTVGIVRVNGQYSPNRLFVAEQMQIGGPYTLRGYQPAELIGDYGVTGTVEFRTPVPGLRKILPNKIKFIDDKLRLAAFYDWGWVKEHNHLYDYPQNFLHSVGFGSYIGITDWMSLELGVGFPLGKKYYGENTARFYFGLHSELDNIIPKKHHEDM